VAGVYTHDEIAPVAGALSSLAPARESAQEPRGSVRRSALAQGEVLFAGEPVAAVVAAGRGAAIDAASLVDIRYEPLRHVLDPAEALHALAPVVHPARGSNLACERSADWGDAGAAFSAADRVVASRFVRERRLPAPLEPRGAQAQWREAEGELVLWTSTQTPHEVRAHIAAALRLDECCVRVIVPDVGGAFGAKLGASVEELLVCALARKLAPRAVKWTEWHREGIAAGPHGRSSVSDVEIAVREDGKLLGIRVACMEDVGAYVPVRPAIASRAPRAGIAGAYGIPAGSVSLRSVLTHKTPATALRGSQEGDATYLIERSLEAVAADLELDPLELRRRNLEGRAAPGLARVLEKLAQVSRYESLRSEQQARRQSGEVVGIGVALHAGAAPGGEDGEPGEGWESATVHVSADGNVEVLAGCVSSGQGHETVLAQIAADVLGVALEDVRVRRVDTRASRTGSGTFGSRSAVLGGSAVLQAAKQVERKLRGVAARLLRVSEDYVERVGPDLVAGVKSVRYTDVCRAAHGPIPAEWGISPGLEESVSFPAGCVETASGAHLCVTAIDGDTGEVRVERYVAVEDAGRVIHPGIVEGQIQGAIIHGIGLALGESVDYDETGQLLTASLLDYTVRRAFELPRIVVVRLETPAAANPLGVRGIGEPAATALAATVNSVLDALRPLGVEHLDPPLTPAKLWRVLATDSARRLA